MSVVAEQIDRHDGDGSFGEAVALMKTKIEDPDKTPSARILAELEREKTGFFRFAFAMAQKHRDYFASITQPNDAAALEFRQEAEASLKRQQEIEATDTMSLDEYLAHYYH